MTDTLLNISGVNKMFGGLQALTDVNLQIEAGKTHAIIGPKGAGTSTLINVCRVKSDIYAVDENG
ncbi:MAG: ATP-binding cassette domain-containing protein, partial [Pseudomonadota bacterium]